MTAVEKVYLEKMASSFAEKAKDMKLLNQPKYEAIYDNCSELVQQIKRDFERFEEMEHEQTTS